eukprot:GHVU01016972.1.p2 GENE.GHVU01016972.1~~GHVU01016972.1.p2  ORF type:complete len:123 (-),score=5.82 GHVU01016972.1:514-882(-)
MSVGVILGKFTKSKKFRLQITAIDLLARHCTNKIWLSPAGEQSFVYGNNVIKVSKRDSYVYVCVCVSLSALLSLRMSYDSDCVLFSCRSLARCLRVCVSVSLRVCVSLCAYGCDCLYWCAAD